MKKYVVALLLSVAFSSAASADEGPLRLTLHEAIKMAVERNLDVQVELYNPASAEADIYKYQGIYNPLLSFLLNYQDSRTLSATIGGMSLVKQSSSTFNAGATQFLPTGGTIGAGFNNSWNHNNFGLGATNHYFQSDVTLSLSQPLLKNFGRETTELNIDVARFNREGLLNQFKFRLIDILTQVETQYFQLYSLRKNLEVKQTSLKLAQTILTNTQAQVKAGVLPAMEILNAQFGVATQQKNVVDAERALKDQVDSLRLLLQVHEFVDIVPIDTPYRDNYAIDEKQSIKMALDERPDLKQQRVTLKTDELQSRVARNQTLPDLSLISSASFTGLSNTYNRDLERVGSAQYPVWGIGLQFSYPIGNDSAKNDYIKSKLKIAQTQTQIKSLEDSVVYDVRTAARAVRSGYVQLEVTRRGSAYADEVLQAFIKKQKVGLATTKDVMDVLNNQVAAQGNEFQAVADYNKAIVALWKATGELLGRYGITLGEKESNDLYNKFK